MELTESGLAQKGLWLVSADGDKIIYQFTENSPLLSNDVKQLTNSSNNRRSIYCNF
jgi:hypothetical protein